MKFSNVDEVLEELFDRRSFQLQEYEAEITCLISTLACELKRVQRAKDQGKMYMPNSHGIVQSQGKDIDNLALSINLITSLMNDLKVEQ